MKEKVHIIEESTGQIHEPALSLKRLLHELQYLAPIQKAVKEKLDHQNLNEVLPFNTTAENIARWVCEQVPHCFKVEVQESESNTAIYEKD